MAKSARSSDTKRNHRNLRAKVFGPAHDARTARLSAKLQELAAKPRVTEDKVMEVDHTAEKERKGLASLDVEEMEVDAQGSKMKPVTSQSTKNRAGRKVHKVSKRKPRNSMVFASEQARKKRTTSKKSKA